MAARSLMQATTRSLCKQERLLLPVRTDWFTDGKLCFSTPHTILLSKTNITATPRPCTLGRSASHTLRALAAAFYGYASCYLVVYLEFLDRSNQSPANRSAACQMQNLHCRAPSHANVLPWARYKGGLSGTQGTDIASGRLQAVRIAVN